MSNLFMPGDPRYQPRSLRPYFGHDRLVNFQVEVELAAMHALAELGIIPSDDYALLSDEVVQELHAITTTEVDEIEKTTKHDIRALVIAMQRRMPERLKRWVHIPLTSYDVIDTARALMYRSAHEDVVQPLLKKVIRSFESQARRYATAQQMGRTHGQHALPITVGFWLATILSRLVYAARELDRAASRLCGKVSGPVGAFNAQVALKIYEGNQRQTFEEMVLSHLDVPPSSMSTQIVPPEPLAEYLFAITLVSAALGQFGRDARHLMRTEIGELSEPFSASQTGSSTMAHKRNPITFENEEGMWLNVKLEFGKVLETLVSEHQRDLVGSSLARSFPSLVVRLVYQLERLLATSAEDDRPFIERVVPDYEACQRNLAMQGDLTLAEPLYIALQMAGYDGDAHHLVNHTIVEHAKKNRMSLYDAMIDVTVADHALAEIWERVPAEMKLVLQDPKKYAGVAVAKTRETCDRAMLYHRA